MIRAVAWISIVRGVELTVGYLPFLLAPRPTRGATSPWDYFMASSAGLLATGVLAWSTALAWSGALLVRRSARSRNIVVVLTIVGLIDQLYWGAIPSLGRLGRPTGLGRSYLGNPALLAIVATVTLLSLFTVHALLHRPARGAFAPGRRGEPMAPLSSVWRLRRGLRGWVSLGFLYGAVVLAARTVWIRLL